LRNLKPADLAPHLIGTKGSVGKPSSVPAVTNEPLNFKMPASFKREFKMAAVSNGLRMNELLAEAFELWKKERSNERPKGGKEAP
jgi:hypothetical protein